MNRATTAAIRAIVSGLRKSGVISDPHISAIIGEMEASEPDLKRWGSAEWIQYRQLCVDIAGDAGVETNIKAAETPMVWRHYAPPL